MLTFAFALLTIATVCAGASNADTAYMKCWYDYTRMRDTINHQSSKDLMILAIGKEQSVFYSYYTFQHDSLEKEPDYRQKWRAAFLAAYQKDGVNATNFYYRRTTDWVYKDLVRNKIQVYDDIDSEKYTYADNLDGQSWTLIDSTKTIIDYVCNLAEADYHGRHWTAWYAIDIPTDNGPWKLGGLPGLILEAQDDRGEHRFVIKGLQKVDEPIEEKSKEGKYQKTERKTFLKAKRRQQENVSSSLSELTGENISKSPLNWDYLETDYH